MTIRVSKKPRFADYAFFRIDCRRGAAQLLALKDKATAISSNAKGDKPLSKKRKQPGQSQEVTMIADAVENG